MGTQKMSEGGLDDLLKRFNGRDLIALGEVYGMFYRELTYYASKLYYSSDVSADDVVHDIFLKIWDADKLTFSGLDNIKAYIYISIKNGFADWVAHNKCVDKYNVAYANNPGNFIADVVESETLSALSVVQTIMPEDVAHVFKLLVEGWQVKEIASKMNMSQSWVYNKRSEAEKILKDLPKNVLNILLLINGL